MRNRFGDIAEEEETKIDITPMLDVVFIMLIFFIVTATFVNERGLDLNKPPQNNQQQETVPEKGNILIKISSNDTIFISDRQVDFRSVAPNVKRMRSENPDAKVIIQASKRSKNNTLVRVMDGVRDAGVLEPSLAPSTD